MRLMMNICGLVKRILQGRS